MSTIQACSLNGGDEHELSNDGKIYQQDTCCGSGVYASGPADQHISSGREDDFWIFDWNGHYTGYGASSVSALQKSQKGVLRAGRTCVRGGKLDRDESFGLPSFLFFRGDSAFCGCAV